MDTYELLDFNKRIGLNTELDNISKEICRLCDLGDFVSNELIAIGYEDYNYYLETTKNKYCVKIFNKERDKKNIDDYLDRIRVVADSDINAPKPVKINGDIYLSLDYLDNHYDLVVFESIDGKNFYELNEKLTEEEIREIARQTAMINNLDLKPEFIYDSWAIINFKEEYKKKKGYLPLEYQEKFNRLVADFNSIDLDRLPKAFVHGDIINTNVLKDSNGKIWIIDFAVSNYLPRIIDLAVIACNLCLDKDSIENTCSNIKLLLEEYDKYNKLTKQERSVFKTFFRLANAMHILQTTYLDKVEGESEENKYWQTEGITGYKYSEDDKFLINDQYTCLKENLYSFIEEFNEDNITIINNSSDDLSKVGMENIGDFKEIITYGINYLKSKMDKGTIKVDINPRNYGNYVEIYLSIMTSDLGKVEDKEFLAHLKELVDKVDGNLLVDNSEKGIVLMIDFVKEAIIEE